MGESVIVALITGCVAVIGSIITAVSGSKLTAYKIDELKADTAAKIGDLKDDFKTLREKVEKHNNLVERMVVVEQSTKSAHKRIDSVEMMRGHRED